jgi:hypothetical protein
MADDPQSRPGGEWIAIVTRATLEDFARAFAIEAVLEASVLAAPVAGVANIHAFFQATRGMYDRIAFTREDRSGSRTYLEWEGEYRARRVAGVTILSTTAGGAIERIRLFHLPFDQVVEFSADLRQRLEPAGPTA